MTDLEKPELPSWTLEAASWRPVNPDDLPTARGLHLWMVCRLGRRDDYARGTDGDLL